MELPKFLKAYRLRCDANKEHQELLKGYYLVNDGTNVISGVVSPREVKDLTTQTNYAVRMVSEEESRACPLCQHNSHSRRGKEFLEGLVAAFRERYLPQERQPRTA
jgi:hypothetical protein